MSDKAGVTHDTIARLLGLPPADLEKLVQAGHIRRNDRNNYSVPVAIEGYVALLKAQIAGTAGHPKQNEVGAHLDLSDRSVREWEAKLALPADYTMADIRVAYIRRLREEAAGRATDGDLDLATERARLAKEQADKVAMHNAITRGELAPVAAMEAVLATVGTRVGKILDTIPGLVRRRVPGIGSDVIEHITADIAKCRNMAAAMTLASLEQEDDDAEADAIEQPAPDEAEAA